MADSAGLLADVLMNSNDSNMRRIRARIHLSALKAAGITNEWLENETNESDPKHQLYYSYTSLEWTKLLAQTIDRMYHNGE